MLKPVNLNFFKTTTLNLAKKLLGNYLVYETTKGIIVGKIVETEAYLKNDPASHSIIGKTKRNSPMFEQAGMSYVYFTYGLHYCFNVVSGKKGEGEAILIRAVEPIKGTELMKKYRGREKLNELTNGPAKLTKAYGINKKHNFLYLNTKPLYISKNNKFSNFKVIKTSRIGIKKGKDLPYRFYIKGNKFVSKK